MNSEPESAPTEQASTQEPSTSDAATQEPSASTQEPSTSDATTSHTAKPPRNSVGNVLWWFVLVQAGLLVTVLPMVLVVMWVEGGVVAVLAYAVAGLLLGPTLQSGMYALRRPDPSLRQNPWDRYWEGWRSGWRQSLAVWAPVVVVLAGVQVLAGVIPSGGVARPLVIVGYIMGGVLAVASVATLSVISRFSFRTRDVVRVALFGMGSKPVGTVGLIVVLFMMAWALMIGFEAVLGVMAVLICWALLFTTGPMHRVIRKRLVAEPQ